MAQSAVIPQAKAAVLMTVEGLDQYWEKFSGIKDNSSASGEFSDGQGMRLYKISGPRTLEDMTLEKAFDPLKDGPVLEYWRNYSYAREAIKVVSITLVNSYNPEPQPGQSFTLYGVRPLSVEIGEGDKTSNDVMMLILKFIAEDWEFAS